MENSFDKLVNEIKSCRDCRNIFGFEPNPVFSGNENSKILQISQAPSQNVHKTNKCFNDVSGKKLRNEWYQISDKDFYNDDNFYISAIGHCYPGKSSNGGDRKPPKHCADKWLWQEIKFVKSKIIILIGRYSAQYFFPKIEFPELIFNNQKIDDKLTIVLPHPSPLNQRWFKKYPEFETERLPEIRKIIHKVLYSQK
ncbi:MAG: uracil-DNA glycosylase family protein [Patescibacteria group bacterium]|nr:uracil-DNA glycosylase family protein [Patescibacteria group bacterium]